MLLALLERDRRCELLLLLLVRCSLICLSDRSDMLLSRLGVEGPAAGLLAPTLLSTESPVAGKPAGHRWWWDKVSFKVEVVCELCGSTVGGGASVFSCSFSFRPDVSHMLMQPCRAWLSTHSKRLSSKHSLDPSAPGLFLAPWAVASTNKLMDTDDFPGRHALLLLLLQPLLQLVRVEPLLLLLLLLFAFAAAAAAAAAVAAAMLAAAGVTPHMRGGGLGPCLAL